MQPSMTIDDKIKIVAEWINYTPALLEATVFNAEDWNPIHLAWAKLYKELPLRQDTKESREAENIRDNFLMACEYSNLPAAFEAVVSGIQLLNNKK